MRQTTLDLSQEVDRENQARTSERARPSFIQTQITDIIVDQRTLLNSSVMAEKDTLIICELDDFGYSFLFRKFLNLIIASSSTFFAHNCEEKGSQKQRML